MTSRSLTNAVPPTSLVTRVALVIVTLAMGLAPAAAAVMADIAPAFAQEPSPCGDKPCEEVPTNVSPCGDRPCGEVPANVSPCGDRPCGEVPANVSPCGDRPCGEVPANVNPCGDKPCGEASAEDVNKPNPDAAEGDNANNAGDQSPASSAPGDDAANPESDEAAQSFDGENTGSSSSGWILPVLFVILAAAALFWVVRRNRASADTEV